MEFWFSEELSFAKKIHEFLKKKSLSFGQNMAWVLKFRSLSFEKKAKKKPALDNQWSCQDSDMGRHWPPTI